MSKMSYIFLKEAFLQMLETSKLLEIKCEKWRSKFIARLETKFHNL